MKRKNGFTLIELLAVIVILAIIALIATPTILGVIDNAKKGAAQSSALGYIDAVEKQVAINMLDSSKENIADRTYSVEELKELGVTIKGTLPTGNVVISKGQITDYILGIDGYVIENGNITKVNNTKKYDNGYVIYYDPTTGESCDTYKEANSLNEIKKGCMKWYVYNDKEGNATINMILDHNTTARIKWNDDNINVAYENSNLKPVVDDLVTTSKWKNIPRLITAYEINEITEKTDWTNTSGWYYFDTKTQTQGAFTATTRSNYDWLYNNLNLCKTDSTDYGCTLEDNNTYTGYGTAGDGVTTAYWTSTTHGSAGFGSYVWLVRKQGYLGNSLVNDTRHGIRPVITISKSIIS